MKVREGFVSNSSSTSFLIYGICIPHDNISKEDIEFLEDNKYKLFDVDAFYEYNTEYVYIGEYPTKIKDYETGGEFKDRIKKEVIKALSHIGEVKNLNKDNPILSYIEEAYYDG